MKVILRFFLIVGIFYVFSDSVYSQTPGTKVPGSSNIYYGTKSNRTSGGVPTWNYYRHTQNDTDWDTSPYKDFFFQRLAWEATPTNFRFLFPQEYDNNGEEAKYPLIIMLHGLGEGGGRGLLGGGYSNYVPSSNQYNVNFYLNNNNQLKNGGKIHLQVSQGTDTHGPDGTSREFPGFMMFPQTVTSTHNGQTPGWANLQVLIELIEDLVKTFPVDLNRIYVHGLSNGGNATWKIVEMRPDLFAAYLPMAGHPQGINLTKISHIPLWLFQGGDDKTATALPAQAREAIEDLEALGATPRYTEFQGVGHNAWDPAYKQMEFFSWMLGQSKTNIQVENGRTAYCEGSPFSVKLQVDPNFADYQWKKNGVIIPGATQHFYEATEYASYEASFLRSGSTVREWSDPVEISIQDLTDPVQITAHGSTTLPGLDGANSVKLTAPEGYVAYNWQNSSGTTSEITVSSAGDYRVSVTEENGCASNYSPAIKVTVEGPTDAVVAPSQLTGETVSSSRINLFWQDNSDNEKGFEIYRATQAGGPYQFVTKTKSNVVYFADKNLSASTEYYYILRAVNDIGSSPPTAELSLSTAGDISAPSRPHNLIASANLDLTSITLTWDSSKDDIGVSGYTVYRVEGGNLTAIETTTDTTFTHSGLIKDTNYTYVVKATDASGKTSEQSNQASVTTIFCGLQYNLYANFIYNFVSDIGADPAELKGTGKMSNFSISPGIDYYNSKDEPITYFGIIYEGYIYLEAGAYTFNTRSDDGSTLTIDGQLVVSNDKRQSATTVEGTFNAATSKAYRITVKYFNSGGGYEFSVKYKAPGMATFASIPNDILCSTVGAPSPSVPNVPLSFTAQAVSDKQINLSWTPDGTDATGFEIYRSKSDQNSYSLITTVDEETTSYEDGGLEASSTYFYKIRAIGLNGESEFSNAGMLTYKYYEGSWNSIPNFSNLSPILTGKISNFDISDKTGQSRTGNNYENFGFTFEGKINVVDPGNYTFYTSSDDGSRLFINGVAIVDNDGLHSTQERSSTPINLTQGEHSIKVEYFDKTQGEVLQVRYQGPGIPKQLIPDDALNSGLVFATTLGDTEAPSAPGGLAIKSVSNTSVGLSWDPSTDNIRVVGYQIFNVPTAGDTTYIAQTDTLGDVVDNIYEEGDEDTGPTVNFINSSFDEVNASSTAGGMSILSENAVTAVTRVSTSIGGLTNGTVYNFTVKAIDAAGNLSAPSNVVTVTTGEETPLPIELVDFFAIPKENHVEITWITASETNNDYFVILRSLDGKDFKEIGTVDGSGDSNELLYYLFNDEQPINGIMYYQLKQIDTNGVFSNSRIIKVDYKKDQGVFGLKIYPNPVKNYDFKVELSSSNKESKVHVKIIDMLGKIHLNEVYDAEDLLNTLHMSKSGLSGGMYIMSVQQADRAIQTKFIVE